MEKTSSIKCRERYLFITKKKYGKHVEFVGICEDKEMNDFKAFSLKNPQYNWLLLYDNTGTRLKKEYEISSFPTYFLIDPQGKFVQAPADGPEEYIDRLFYDMTKPKARKINVGDKKNR